MRISFETIRFFDAKDGVRGLLLKYFRFSISDEELSLIGPYHVEDGDLVIDAHEKKRKRFLHILQDKLVNQLTCTITQNPATYIDRASDIPLQGALEFGVIDRGTNILEVRPCSGCNLACTYCSVAEGPGGPKKREFVIEKDYLLDQIKKLVDIKEHPVEIYFETQGEPLLYADLSTLIRDLKADERITTVTLVTNGTFLSEQMVDELADAGLDRINWSINALDPEMAKEIAGRPYNVERIKEMIMYTKDKIDVLMCPVIMKDVNVTDMDEFVEFAKQVRKKEPIIAFQNFLYYKGGRNPVKEVPMPAFEEKIKELEDKHGTRLRLTTEDFTIEYDNSLDKPFKKRDIVTVRRLFKGRLANETMCAASGRIVKVIGRTPEKDEFAVQILRDKHNVFLAKAV